MGLSIKSIDKDNKKFTLGVDSIPSTPMAYPVTVKATLEDGTVVEKTKNVTIKVTPTVAISGASSFVAKNGTGSSDYTFVYTPSEYNVDVELVSVTSSNSTIVVSNATTSGFTLSVSGTTADVSGTITAVLKVDGTEVTLTQSVTATYSESWDLEAVDLGLPSGTLWANMNIGADNPYESGEYFQFGSINGHTRSEGYVFSSSNYPEYGNVPTTLTDEYDAAIVNLGSEWSIPTYNQADELINNTTGSYIVINKKSILKVTSNINGNSIYFNTETSFSGTSSSPTTYLWTKNAYSSSRAHTYSVYPSYKTFLQNPPTYYGCVIRAVQNPS